MKRPNILFIFTDQQRRESFRAGGAGWMKTPNLDRLAREGCLFERASSQCPVCMPARHNLLTGHHCESTGYYDNSEGPMRRQGLPVYPQMLSDAGYRTGSVGKQHFWPSTRTHGFHEFHLHEEITERRQDNAYFRWMQEEGLGHVRAANGINPLLYHTPQRSVTDEAHHPVTWVTDRSLEFIDRNLGRPWFLMASYIAPHPPWAVPERLWGAYAEADIPDPVPCCRSEPWPAEGSPYFGDGEPQSVRRAEREAYFTMIHFLDEQVGRLLDGLEARGVLNETVVIFSSDHGEMLGDRGFYQKSLPYEPSIGIPLLVRAPGRLDAGSRCGTFVDHLDLMPTFLDLAGIDYADYAAGGHYQLEGRSLFEVVRRGSAAREGQWANFGTGRKRWILQRDERYKYIFWYNGGIEEFYDLEADPGEQHNLVGCAGLPSERFEALRTACFARERRHAPPDVCFDGRGHPEPLALERFPEHHWDGSKYPEWMYMQFVTFAAANPVQNWPFEVGAAFEAERFREELLTALDGEFDVASFFLPDRHRKRFGQFFGYLTQGLTWSWYEVKSKRPAGTA